MPSLSKIQPIFFISVNIIRLCFMTDTLPVGTWLYAALARSCACAVANAACNDQPVVLPVVQLFSVVKAESSDWVCRLYCVVMANKS